MRIAFATIFDPRDITRGSGTFYYMSHEMEQMGHQLFYVGPVPVRDPIVTRVNKFVHREILRKRYKTYLDPFVAYLRGRAVSGKLEDINYDILITNDFAIAGYTRTEKPIVLYTDAMIPFDYPSGVHPQSRIAGLSSVGVFLYKKTISRGLERATLSVFPAEWSASEALKYHSFPNKIKVIPFGANIKDPGKRIASQRDFQDVMNKKQLNLLFVGKDWERKGGNTAVKTINELNKRNIPAVLNVVGAIPPASLINDRVYSHGLLNKSKPEDERLLTSLYQTSDIFILPSVSEGFVIAALEAAAYGLPTLAYNVNGVNQAVKNGQSGILVPLSHSVDEFIATIEKWYNDPEAYNQLAIGARRHFEKSVNWSFSLSTLFSEIKKML